MLPSELTEKAFSRYPTQARDVAVASLPVLRRIPLALLPLFLRQLINYDWLFPPEQRDLVRQLNYLGALPASQFDPIMQPFAGMHLSSQLIALDWVNLPKHFAEQLSAFLWSVHQIDNYHRAVQVYLEQVETDLTSELPETARYTMVAIGAGVKETNLAVFRRLAPYGTLFTSVDANSAWQILSDTLRTRAHQYRREHAHWYIDGGDPAPDLDSTSGINIVSYGRLAPVVRKVLSLMNGFATNPPPTSTTDVESTTSYMADMEPEELGLGGNSDSVLHRFELEVLTEGAGTQVYSTTFVQWTARQCLHRAQPLTLLARFRPRQEGATMNELLARDPFTQKTDTVGALVDADMGAYLTWINQGRLPGADQSRFLAWFEGRSIAIAIGPSMAKGTISDTPTDLGKVLGWMA
jgi:hypothetical protein